MSDNEAQNSRQKAGAAVGANSGNEERCDSSAAAGDGVDEQRCEMFRRAAAALARGRGGARPRRARQHEEIGVGGLAFALSRGVDAIVVSSSALFASLRPVPSRLRACQALARDIRPSAP